MEFIDKFIDNIEDNEKKFIFKNKIYRLCNQVKYIENKSKKLNFIKNNQIGGENKKINIDNNIYYYNSDKLELIDKKDQLYDPNGATLNKVELTFYTLENKINGQSIKFPNEKGCGAVLYYKKDDNVVIEELSNYDDCIKCKDVTVEYKVGVILMQVMLYEINKYIKPKSISIHDNAFMKCVNDKLQLIYLRTITKGEPYYTKFGFIAKDINVYNYNKMIFNKQIMIKEIAFYELLTLKKSKNLFTENEKDRIKNKILPYYEKNKNKLASEFLNGLLRNNKNCSIIAKIYLLLYKNIGYKEYNDKSFYINYKK